MHSGPGRRHRRPRQRDDRSQRRVEPVEELDPVEEAARRVRELEDQLLKKDRFLAEQAKRLAKNGVSVELDSDNDSYLEENSGHMSPIRIGVSRRRSQSSSSANNYRNSPPHNYQNNHQPYSGYQFEPPQNDSNQFYYENTDYQNFDPRPPQFYRDDQDVRVEEMPKWPMHNSPSPQRHIPEQQRSFSPTPAWRHQQDIQVDPMPIFPMNGENPEQSIQLRREDMRRMQYQVIAEQAEQAEIESRAAHEKRMEEKKKAQREREEKREARHHIGKLRNEVVQEMRDKERERDLKRREAEREKRHAQKKREEEEAAAKRREARRKEEDNRKRAETDEYFLQCLIPAIGKLECQSTRIEGKNPVEYVSKCHAVNIPKEILYGSKISETKGDSYKGAISNYVDKLTGLGVVDTRTRGLMKRIEKLPKFLAELVEPLCDDIAIYGTQISVTDAVDMRSKFDKFAKEKCSEFWKNLDNREKLDDFLRRYDRKRNPTRSRSRDRKRNCNNRRRSSSRERRPPSLSSEEQLKQLFATTGNGITPTPNALLNQNPLPSFQTAPPNNFVSQQSGVPSLLSMPLVPPPHTSQPMGSYMQPPPVAFPTQSPFDHQPMNGYAQYQQQPMMQQQVFNSQPPPCAPGFPPNISAYDDEAALLDEIYS
ncbi:hypothetical protein CAEBREN_01196 [Caenorhabditis brenneri]|uniref:Uncharacterized protein n=1 Tax=Caenorhabditis brenneri TaxID=135651 RepID=G0MTU1_CAEBE|nr:hypothetical protein CAEBREN_01196 [Caenorhabditis brenneri]